MRKISVLVVVLLVFSMFGCAKVVFVSKRDGHNQIYRMQVNGSVQTNLSANQFPERFPDASPDGKKVVFSSLRDGVAENIFIMDVNGGGIQQLTSGTNRKIRPRWSPKQDRVAYAEFTSGNSAKIFIMPSGGGASIQVTAPDQNHSDTLGHDFFDNGTKIIFARSRLVQGGSQLYYKNADGSGSSLLVPNTLPYAYYPVVSHDGSLLAYRVKGPNLAPGTPEWILVHKVGTWQKIAEFPLQPPVPGLGSSIRGISFSRGDDLLYVGARAADVAGGGDNRLEIFSIKLDGTGQERLTENTAPDSYPSAVPAP